MKLSLVLEKIKEYKNYRKKIVSAGKGESFEQNLLSEVIEDGEYTTYNINELKKHKSFQEIKKILQTYNENSYFIKTNLLNNICDSPRVVFQAFGKQNSPDLLFIRKGKILALECKFTNKKTKAPVWNSGLPKCHYNYIFGSWLLEDITFFSGRTLINKTEREKIQKLVKEARKNLKDCGKLITNQFKIYLRPMYNQVQELWKLNNRNEIETNLINGVKDFEK